MYLYIPAVWSFLSAVNKHWKRYPSLKDLSLTYCKAGGSASYDTMGDNEMNAQH